MGIYLKDMKMPKNCADCSCASIFTGYKCMACGRQFDKYPFENKMDWCPLVEVPPHGKLIDANEFLHRAIGTKCFNEDYARMLQQLVGESVTIIPAEEGN